MAPRRERVAAPVVALLLLSTAVASPAISGPVGVASAEEVEDCSGVDAVIYDVVTIGNHSLVDTSDHPCSPQYQRDQAVQDLTNATTNQTKLDIYNAALAQRAENQVFSDVVANYANDSRSIAWMHAETAIAESYKDGDPKSVAKSHAKTDIADYYSKKQINLIKRWNASIAAYNALHEVAANTSGINADDFLRPHAAADVVYVQYRTEKTVNVTLANGTVVQSKALEYEERYDTDTGFQYKITLWSVKGIQVLDAVEGDYNFADSDRLGVRSPDATHSKEPYVDAQEFADAYNRFGTMNTDLQNEVDPFVNGTWTAYQDGQINASDVISRNNLMFRYGTDALNNTNQSLYDSTAALSTMGLDTPNINSTGSMTVVYNNVSYTGMVLAREAPNGTWETGKTYKTANIGGVVLLATTDGQRLDMEGEFRLESMKNQEGEQIEQTSATKVVYRTSNTSEILDKMERILELRAQIEATKPKAGGGGTTSDTSNSSILDQIAALLGVSAGAAVLVLGAAALLVMKIYSPS